MKILPLHTDMPQLSCGERETLELAVSEDSEPGRLLIHYLHFIYYLLVKCMNHMHPVVLYRVIAVYRLGEAAAHVDHVVEGHCSDTALGDGDVGS